MTIEIKPGRYFLAYWMLGDGGTRDWLCAAWRDGDKWEIQYRFRYYKDDKLGPESEDKRSWYDVHVGEQATEEEVERLGDHVQQMLEFGGFGQSPEKCLIRSDDFDVVTSTLKKHAETSQYLHVEEHVLQ